MSTSRAGVFKETYVADEAIFDTAVPRLGVVVLVVALALLPLGASNYVMDVVNRIGIAIVGAMGLNILTGFTGQISVGNAAFLAVGAYTSANVTARLGLPFLVGLPAAGVTAALVGLVFGLPSLRLKELYLAMATLAAHFIIEFTVVHWTAVTGGVFGMTVPPPAIAGIVFDNDRKMFYVIFAVVVVTTLFAKNLFRTRAGRAFMAIRDHDISAEVLGVNVYGYKLLAFAVGSFYVGLAGSLLAHQARIITPENFPIGVAIDYLGMIIIGGMGSILGSIFGAIFMTLVPEILRVGASSLSGTYPTIVSLLASIREGVFGLLIILFLIFEPDGLAARWHTVRSYWKLWPFSY
jgi:branched-chain amino acid transport system permease protein